MTRIEFESACQSALNAGKETLQLRLPGDPSSRRVRLLGHRFGPYGAVTGWAGDKVVASFDVGVVCNYLDALPTEEVSGNDEIGVELFGEATP